MEITSISQLDLSKQYSYADYLTWRIEERIELIKGWVRRMSAPSIAHKRISLKLSTQMENYLENFPCELFTAPTDVCLMKKNDKNEDVKTVLQPDLLVVCDLGKLDKNRVVGAPDLVVEIVSPVNSNKEMQYKFELYEENGVREYWIVYPESESIAPFVLNEDGKFVGLRPRFEDEILTSAIFPDLTINLEKVFAGNRPTS